MDKMKLSVTFIDDIKNRQWTYDGVSKIETGVDSVFVHCSDESGNHVFSSTDPEFTRIEIEKENDDRPRTNADYLRSLDDDKLADFCKKADEKSVAIFVCVRRYSFRLLEAAKIIKKKKTKIITINDSPDSPFIPYSDVSFITPCDSCDFHNSVIAPMLIAEMLISSTIARNSSATLNSLSGYEQYSEALGQFVIKD